MIKKRNKKIWAAIFIGLMFFLIPISTMTVNAWESTPVDEYDSAKEDQNSIEGLETAVSPFPPGIFPYPPPPETIEMEYSFSFTMPIITEIIVNGTVYHIVTIDECPSEGDVGEPILPIKPVNVLLPQKGVLHSIEVSIDNEMSLGVGYNVEIGTEPVIPGDENISDGAISFDPTVPFPTELFLEVGTYDLRGYSISSFNLFPVHYIGETGEIYYYENMMATVTATLDGSVSPFFRDLPEDELLIEVEEEILDNYEMILTYTELPENPPYRGSIVDPSENYGYVIITNNDLKNAQGEYTFQTLQNYKNDGGTSTIIVTVEDIYANYNGIDEQEKIRNFIKDAYGGWNIEYVLLGGDKGVIPVRDLYVDLAGLWESEKYVPSDLYYACLDGSYNSDDDNKWGEPDDGQDISGGSGDVDLRAEVYIGRTCVQNNIEVTNFVSKTISYAESIDNYLGKVLMVGEFLFGPATHWSFLKNYYGGDYMDQLIEGCWATGYYTAGIPSNKYDFDKLYDKDWPGFDPWNPEETGWPVSEIINRINNNIHIINHLGHGNNEHNMKIEIPDVDSLTNEKYSFIYSQACHSGAFDNIESYDDCIAEHFTVKSEYGAFAGIWNTRYGIGARYLFEPRGHSHHFHRQFWDAIYRESEYAPIKKQIGPANQDSKHDNIFRTSFGKPDNRYCYYEITLFGDPQIALKIPPENDPPYPPSNPNPPDGTSDISIYTTLSWTGDDPDPGDTLTYDVYFGTDSTPDSGELVSEGQTGSSYYPGPLQYNTHYYWKIIARDSYGVTTDGPIWDFTTGDQPNNPPYTPSNPNPVDGAIEVSINAILSWTGGDPDSGDIVRYDVYLEANDATPDFMVSYNQLGTTYDPGTLEYGTHYYWMIVARDNHGETTDGPIWDFTTFVPDPGYIEGHIYDYNTGQPISGALVSTDGDSDTTSGSGYYHLTVNPGTYDVTASKSAYQSDTVYALIVASDQTIVQDFYLSMPSGWVSPTGHNDPENAWDDEPYAYDGNTATKAGCEITEFGWTWTPYIQLTLPTPIHINKIRFWAWYDSDHCDEIDIDVFWQSTPGVGGYWTNVYEGSYEDREWVEKPFQYSGYVTKARIRFEVQRWLLWPVVADLHEFKFYHVI